MRFPSLLPQNFSRQEKMYFKDALNLVHRYLHEPTQLTVVLESSFFRFLEKLMAEVRNFRLYNTLICSKLSNI